MTLPTRARPLCLGLMLIAPTTPVSAAEAYLPFEAHATQPGELVSATRESLVALVGRLRSVTSVRVDFVGYVPDGCLSECPEIRLLRRRVQAVLDALPRRPPEAGWRGDSSLPVNRIYLDVRPRPPAGAGQAGTTRCAQGLEFTDTRWPRLPGAGPLWVEALPGRDNRVSREGLRLRAPERLAASMQIDGGSVQRVSTDEARLTLQVMPRAATVKLGYAAAPEAASRRVAAARSIGDVILPDDPEAGPADDRGYLQASAGDTCSVSFSTIVP